MVQLQKLHVKVGNACQAAACCVSADMTAAYFQMTRTVLLSAKEMNIMTFRPETEICSLSPASSFSRAMSYHHRISRHHRVQLAWQGTCSCVNPAPSQRDIALRYVASAGPPDDHHSDSGVVGKPQQTA